MKCSAVVIASILFFAACEDGTQPELLAPEVSTTLDVASATPVSTFTVTNTNDAGPGSLRQAILDANGSPGTDLIDFNIPGTGPHTIQPASALPPITDPVIIDGYTQPGARRNRNPVGEGIDAVLQIELDGTNAGGGTSGILIAADNSSVEGLVINRFDLSGIQIFNSSGTVVAGNFVGTDVTGTKPLSNLSFGILISFASENVVGGMRAEARNLISGNQDNGILISGSTSVGNSIQGNLIGTNASGTAAIRSSEFAGVEIRAATGNIIGGASPSTRNVISGGNRHGVFLRDRASFNLIQGNLVGTDITGAKDLGNSAHGIFIQAAAQNTIGGKTSGAGNIISANDASGVSVLGTGATGNIIEGNFIGTDVTGTVGLGNGAAGVSIRDGTSNAILSNSIGGNGGLGIGLGNDGVTANDAGDLDTGPNNLQNFPVLTSALATRGQLVVRGTIDTPNPRTVIIELFANPVPTPGPDPSGHGEGAVFLGTVRPNPRGTFTATLPPVAPGTLISATATDADGNTSEFAANIEAVAPGH